MRDGLAPALETLKPRQIARTSRGRNVKICFLSVAWMESLSFIWKAERSIPAASASSVSLKPGSLCVVYIYVGRGN